MKRYTLLFCMLICSVVCIAQADGRINEYFGDYLSSYISKRDYLDTVYSRYWVKNIDHSFIRTYQWSISGLNRIEGWHTENPEQYVFSLDGDALKLTFNANIPADNVNKYKTGCDFNRTTFKGSTGKSPFEYAGDTLYGEIFSYNEESVDVWVKCKSNKALNLRLDLYDANGRCSNRISPRQDIVEGDTYNWYYFSFSDTALTSGQNVFKVGLLADSWSESWNGVPNGRYDSELPPLYGRAGHKYAVLLDPDLITGIGLTIDDGIEGDDIAKKELRGGEIVLGSYPYDMLHCDCLLTNINDSSPQKNRLKIHVGAKSISSEEIITVYSMLGEKIAEGTEILNCPSGLLLVKSRSGKTAKVIMK